jgi:2-C-methyl-D-erythritol 2,4-cyclodiphosphate synthase
MDSFRVGIGYDVHPLKAGARLVLGGVDIASNSGAVGHSDADVLVHAIIDALLGAGGLRDIGQQFPDTDMSYKDANSLDLLKETMTMLRDKGFDLTNMDSTICLESPKIATYVPQMLCKLSEAMQVDISRLSVKATTTEKLGFIGAGQGISAYAVVLIHKM